MTAEAKPSAVAQFGPVGAPILGVILMGAFIAAAYFMADVSGETEKLNQKVQAVNKRLTDPQAKLVPPEMPSVESVLRQTTADDRAPFSAIAGEVRATNLPTEYKVNIVPKQEDDFQKYDADKDRQWDQGEFDASGYATKKPPPANEFKNWDRHKVDGLISREEFDDPPLNPDEVWAASDKNKDGELKPPEITPAEVEKMDRGDGEVGYDGKITRPEFDDRYKEDDSVDLGPVTELTATANTLTMSIDLTWKAPAVGKLPPDIQYLIERKCPKLDAEREKKWGADMRKYRTEFDAWNVAFEAWWNEDVPPDKTLKRKDVQPDRRKAEEEFVSDAAGRARPAGPPQKPEEWEVVGLESGTTYQDKSFTPEFTYTYAVRTVTSKPLKKGQRPDRREDGKKFSSRTEQSGHLIRVRNPVIMAWQSIAGTSATIALSKWFRLGSGADEGWYQVTIREDVSQDDPVGGSYNAAQVKDKKGEAKKVGETTPADIASLLADAPPLDFSTGFTFDQTSTNSALILQHRDYGRYELPKATKDPMPAQTAPSSNAMLEVRVLALGEKDATFEINRWLQVGKDWFRVEMIQKVARGGTIGTSVVNVAENTPGVQVWDGSDNKVAPALLKTRGAGNVDLSVGKFVAPEGRSLNLEIGGKAEKLDLFGALYR